jgi:hypothetical protein
MVEAFTRNRTSPWPGSGTAPCASRRWSCRARNAALLVIVAFIWRLLPIASLQLFEPTILCSRRLEKLVYGGVISPFMSQRSSQVWPSFHRKTWPLIKRQLRSMAAMARISSSVSGSPTTPSRLAR